jgi:hypothetical protein
MKLRLKERDSEMAADAARATVLTIRSALAQDEPARQVCAIHFTTDALNAALIDAWEHATGSPQERFAVAMRAAEELIEGIGLALTEESPGPGPK